MCLDFTCQCGFSVTLPVSGFPLMCRCGSRIELLDGKPTAVDRPSPSRKASNYVKAFSKWAAQGFPKRTDSEVAKLRGICATCEWFDGEVCTHQDCGCRVARGGFFGDKLRWATEHCPIGKW